MPLIKGQAIIAAGATNDNLLQGSQFEILPFNAHLRFALNGSAAGLVADVYSGTDVLAESNQLNAQNRIPINPDDYDLEDVAGYNERIKIRVRNPTAGPLTVFFGVIITPVG